MMLIFKPKSLAERLQWMAENLPGFREELEAINSINVASSADVSRLPARSASEDSQPGPAAETPVRIYGENAVTLGSGI